MPDTIRDLGNSIDSLRDAISAWQARHESEDDRRFDTVTAKMEQLITARAEQVGAARTIAELAEHRATRNTRIVAFISAGCAILTLCIQKHWLGL